MSHGGLLAVLFICIECNHTYKNIQGVKTLFICFLYNHSCYFKICNLYYKTSIFLGLKIPSTVATSLLFSFHIEGGKLEQASYEITNATQIGVEDEEVIPHGLFMTTQRSYLYRDLQHKRCQGWQVSLGPASQLCFCN